MPIITSVILMTLTVLAIGDKVTGAGMLNQFPQRVAFFAFLALVFIPRVWNAALFAFYRARNRRAAEDVGARQRRHPLPRPPSKKG